MKVLKNCFSQQAIGRILQSGLLSFKPLENTQTNQKFFDDRFHLFYEEIYPVITGELPSDDFVIKGGFLNTTSTPYALHTDGARNPSEKIMCTVLLPLHIEPNCAGRIVAPTAGWLFVFEQSAEFATFFRRGKDVSAFSYRAATTKELYDKWLIGNTKREFEDEEILRQCSHLDREEFYGMSLLAQTDWTIGDCIIFHPHQVHASTNFLDLGIKSKTNLVYSLKYRAE